MTPCEVQPMTLLEVALVVFGWLAGTATYAYIRLRWF